LSYVEILTDNGLTQEQWDNSLFTEYLAELQMKHFMGEGPNAIIQVKEELTKEDGDAITIGMRGRVVGGRISGNSKGVGNEGTMEFYNQRITIDNYRRLVKLENVRMSNKRTGFNVLEQAKMALMDEAAQDLNDDIIDALTDVSSGRVRGRYLYGAADSNWNATHATAEANVDSTNDRLTTDAIEIMKRKAVIPVNALTKMRPMKVKSGKNVEQWFTFMGHTYNFRDLRKFDAAWTNAHLNLPPMGNEASPIYSGSWFKGAWEGVLMYEYDQIPLDATAGASSIQVSHCILLGAQAAAVVWGQRSKFGEEDQDLKHTKIYETHEIRGIQKLVFNRSTPEDNGVVHGFFAAVAD
jgi:N4-gp56 family major capsid protein